MLSSLTIAHRLILTEHWWVYLSLNVLFVTTCIISNYNVVGLTFSLTDARRPYMFYFLAVSPGSTPRYIRVKPLCRRGRNRYSRTETYSYNHFQSLGFLLRYFFVLRPIMNRWSQVLDEGRLVEFYEPHLLLKNKENGETYQQIFGY